MNTVGELTIAPAGDCGADDVGAMKAGLIGGGFTIASSDTTMASVMMGISSVSVLPLHCFAWLAFVLEESLGSSIPTNKRDLLFWCDHSHNPLCK